MRAAAITSYTATASDATDPIRGGQAATGPGSPLTVTGLTVGDRYTFTVTAPNAVGQDPPSGPSNPVIARSVPSAPTLPTAVAGDGEVLLEWTAPGSTGGSPITGYDIFVGTSPNGESATPLQGSPVTGTGLFVTGLTDGKRYYFKVTALNAVGSSRTSNEVSATTSLVAFTAQPGSATDIGVGADGSLWIIGTNRVPGGYGIYRWTSSGWAEVPGGAVTLTVGPVGTPSVVNSNHHIYAG